MSGSTSRAQRRLTPTTLLCAFSTLLLSTQLHATAVPNDFNGDGTSDIAWRNQATGVNYLYQMSAGAIQSSQHINTISSVWQGIGSGDFNNDGKADLLWREPTSGLNYIYLMDGGNITASRKLSETNSAWKVAAIGDFNGDGHSDIYWRNENSGETYLYLINDAAISEKYSLGVIALDWQIVGSGDFNGDGHTDILWRNDSNGENYVHLMQNGQKTKIQYLSVISDANWKALGIVDLDGDGTDDIFWHNQQTGANYIYLMQNGQRSSDVNLNVIPDTLWHLVAVGDYNGDGKGDILWRHQQTGQNFLYLMNGGSIASSAAVNVIADTNWQVIGQTPWNSGDEEPPYNVEGKAQYDAQCSVCHGSEGQGTVIGVPMVACTSCTDVTTLAERIATTMPMNEVQNCTDQCAVDVAEYILQVFNKDNNNNASIDVQLMPPKETLRKAALSLTGRLPSSSEYQLVEDQGEAGLAAAFDSLMQDDAFYERLIEVYNDILLTDKYLPGASGLQLLDGNDYPNRYWYNDVGFDTTWGTDERRFRDDLMNQTNDTMARESLNLIRYVVEHNRPFTEILTANYLIVNDYSAIAMGIEPPPASKEEAMQRNWNSALREAQVGVVPHAGILTTTTFLNRFPTTNTNRNRHRSRMVFDIFLDTDILAIEGSRPEDAVDLVSANPTLDNPSCYSCHNVMDPVASSFQNWDARGRYRPDVNWYSDMEQRGFNGAIMPLRNNDDRSLQWLVAEMVQDPRFAKATVRTLFHGLTGQKPLILPPSDDANAQALYQAQRNMLSKIEQALIDNNYNLKVAVKAVLMTPYFRANALSDQQDTLNQSVGSARLLTPEMLNRKILSTTGIPWRRIYSSNDRLLDNTMRQLYGGIDSDNVTQRITQVNGMMAAVQQRMANKVACDSLSIDFLKPREERLLYPFVARDTAPEDIDGYPVPSDVTAIKRNIQHLHWNLLGEDLALDDTEIQATYDLFYSVWKEGQTLVDQNYDAYRQLPGACRRSRVPENNDEYLPVLDRFDDDSRYTMRAWIAVVTYLLSDYRFVYE